MPIENALPPRPPPWNVEDRLRASEALLSSILDSSNDCIKVLDPDGRLLSMSTGGQRLLEIEEIAPYLGQSWCEIWPEPYRTAAHAAVTRAANGKTGRFIGFCPTVNGTPKWWDVMITAVETTPGTDRRLLAISRDVTEQRLAQEVVTQSEAEYRAIFELSAVGIAQIDFSSTRYIKANPKFCEILGYSAEELKKLSVIDLTPPGEDLEQNLALHQALIRGECNEYTLEKRLVRKDGRSVWVQVTATAVRDERGRVVSIIGMVEDISARKRAETDLVQRSRELEAANRELEAFSYSVSHDLRAPLRAINGFSGALQEDCGAALDDLGRSYLDHIRTATLRMSELIDGLLRLSRVFRAELNEQVIDLSVVAEHAVRQVQAGEPDRTVDIHIEPALVTVGDPTLLHLLMQNLISNAWKFTDGCASTRIEVKRLVTDGREAFFVRDNGVGFDMQYAHKLFQPFERLHGEEAYKGTGIGLATVRRIVQRHGGTVWAEGAPERGATFFFTLGAVQARS